MHPGDYAFKLYDKDQNFFTSIASKKMTPYHYWLDINVKYFSILFIFLRASIYDLKTDENDPSFFHRLRKQHITIHTLHFSNIKNLKNLTS